MSPSGIHQAVKQFGSRSGPTKSRARSGSKLFVKVGVMKSVMNPWTEGQAESNMPPQLLGALLR